MEELRLLDPRWQASYSARRRDEFVQRCHARGLAVTPQRLAVIQALLTSKTHPSAESICATVRKQLSYISLATVHRILEQLCEVSEARKVTLLHDSARYDGHAEPHHHIVCVRCKQIRDIELPAANRLIEGRTSLGEFALLDCSLQINALCKRCRNQAVSSQGNASHKRHRRKAGVKGQQTKTGRLKDEADKNCI